MVNASANFKKSLMNYRYRNDVILVEKINGKELMQAISSAYALIDLSETSMNEVQLLNSMVMGYACHCP